MSRLGWSVAATAAGGLAALGWGLWQARSFTHEPVRLIAEPLARIAASTLTVVRPELPAAPSSAAVAAPPRRPLAADEIDLCGIGVIKAERVGREEIEPPGPDRYQVPKAWLQQSRAAGWAAAHDAWRALGDARSLAAIELTPFDKPVGPGPVRLIELARQSQDPLLMQWAAGLCLRAGGSGACAGHSARQWTRAEPENALAWLTLLGQEPGAAAEALYAMSRATHVAGRWGALPALVDAALPESVPGAVRANLLLEAAVIEGMNLPAFKGLTDECRPAAVVDANRRALCGDIARLLVEQGDTLITWSIGIRLGEWAGWPAARIDALRAEQRALQSPDVAKQTYGDLDKLDSDSCAAVAGIRRAVREVDRLGGELPYLRSVLAQQRAAAQAGSPAASNASR